MTEESRNMFEGMFGIHEKDESKSKGAGKSHNKKKDESKKKPIEYSEKERSYINKYLKIAKNAYEENEIFELIKKYNFDDDLISKDIKRQLDMIQVKGEEYGWSEVKKKEIKPKNNNSNINSKSEKDNEKNKKERKKENKGKIKGKNINDKNNKEKKEEKKQPPEEEYNDDEKYYEQALYNDYNYEENNT